MNEHFIEFCHENGVIGMYLEIDPIEAITVRIFASKEKGTMKTKWYEDVTHAYTEMIYQIDANADVDAILRGEK
jgi:hypothetical protein